MPDLLAAVESFRPTVLIGASGKGGLFTQPVLEAMARVNERPVVFALSNPTSKAADIAAETDIWRPTHRHDLTQINTRAFAEANNFP
jgi:malate dehydrogenase (oxaloacetate-decarboxylating)(NADP+)